MSILVINSGSASLKYKLFDSADKEIGAGSFTKVKSLEQALKSALRQISNLQEIEAVGHRLVHGGDKFIKSTIVDDKVLSELEQFNDLAPLHNLSNLAGIKAAREFLPNLPQVAVFDTAFYANLPEVAQTYALPIQISQKYKIKRYGFHGLSHQFIMEEAMVKLSLKNQPNFITCHLGGGWSVTAIKNGKPVDTSMGWTPLEGLVMMTRSGSLDPGIVVELLKHKAAESPAENLTTAAEKIYNLLNYESGLKGLSGGIGDYQSLLKEMSLGDRRAKLAFDVAIYNLAKYIGAYWSVLEGRVDAIIFTGAIGAGNPITRNKTMARLKFLGDIKVMAIPANEELMIAREVKQIINCYC